MRRFLPVLLAACAVLCAVVTLDRPAAAQAPPCSATVPAGTNLTSVARGSRPGATICLSPGVYPPLVLEAPLPAGLTVRGGDRATFRPEGGAGIRIGAVERLTLSGVAVRGGDPAGIVASGARGLALQNVSVEGATVGLLLRDTTATLTNSSIADAIEAGVVVAGGRLTAGRLSVREATIGAAVLPGGALTWSDGTVEGSAGPAIFAGTPPCADPPLATATLAPCFFEVAGGGGAARVELLDVRIGGGGGEGVLVMADAVATLTDVRVSGRERGGMLVWGGSASVRGSAFEDNGAFGIEFRAYPDSETSDDWATGHLLNTTIIGTKPVDGYLLGDGVAIRGGLVSVVGSSILSNAGLGIDLTEGDLWLLRSTTLRRNGGPGLCGDPRRIGQGGGNVIVENGPVTGACGAIRR